MLLCDLLKSIEPWEGPGAAAATAELLATDITGVQDDSRRVRPGNLFVARSGGTADGAAFLDQAHRAGAAAAITAAPMPGAPLPCIAVPNPAAAASLLANAFFHHPSHALKVLGITGTNGKTTTTYLLRHVLNQLHHRCGLIGTVEIDTGKAVHESQMTTPGAVQTAGLLADMRDSGCRAAAVEISSHALHQHRAAGVRFAGAGFTNLTGDHLDYHKTMDDYAAAKAMLFESLDSNAAAVVNAADAWSARIVKDCRAKIVRFGFTAAADYRASNLQISSAGSRFALHTPAGGEAQITSPLIGKHNVENALTAAALLGEVFGLTAAQIAAGLNDAAGAPGRLQAVRAGQPFAVLVDYAHTDDALANVLSALRPLTRGTLRVLFGCGGDRDRTKRPRMAATAQRLADAVYITSDNPRTEDPASIIEQIAAGLDRSGASAAASAIAACVKIEPDRRRAIAQILADAAPGDVVLIAGKGHENYQIIGTTKHHFDDVEECSRALAARAVAA
jgi:UDP-N-acetylmuramoyl-L-alanyl-D-glutamate--2,6-diaminopimelate ligase